MTDRRSPVCPHRCQLIKDFAARCVSGCFGESCGAARLVLDWLVWAGGDYVSKRASASTTAAPVRNADGQLR